MGIDGGSQRWGSLGSGPALMGLNFGTSWGPTTFVPLRCDPRAQKGVMPTSPSPPLLTPITRNLIVVGPNVPSDLSWAWAQWDLGLHCPLNIWLYGITLGALGRFDSEVPYIYLVRNHLGSSSVVGPGTSLSKTPPALCLVFGMSLVLLFSEYCPYYVGGRTVCRLR